MNFQNRKSICQYFEREARILDICRGKSVLHLGCVGATDLPDEDRINLAPNLLHSSLSKIADVTGVDSSASVIDAYRRLRVFDNIVEGDVQHLEALPIDEPFDVILAGDIIEHLSRPGDLLDGMHRLCKQDTKVIITTPHSFGLPSFVRHALGRFRDGDEHVMSFNSDNMINMLSRHHYVIDSLDTCHQRSAKGWRPTFVAGKILFKLVPRMGGTLFVVARSLAASG